MVAKISIPRFEYSHNIYLNMILSMVPNCKLLIMFVHETCFKFYKYSRNLLDLIYFYKMYFIYIMSKNNYIKNSSTL